MVLKLGIPIPLLAQDYSSTPEGPGEGGDSNQ